MPDFKRHWERVYSTKTPDQVSWFRPHLETSLALIESAAANRSTAIIDVGGGASSLVDDLIAKGYRNITVLDISAVALKAAKERLGEAAELVRWLNGDVTDPIFAPHSFDAWHDRAVFHFLTEPAQRAAYVRNLELAVRPGGHVIVSTFGPEGPARCSGLDVVQYGAESLRAEFGPRFRMVESFTEGHMTPFGTMQQFLYWHGILGI